MGVASWQHAHRRRARSNSTETVALVVCRPERVSSERTLELLNRMLSLLQKGAECGVWTRFFFVWNKSKVTAAQCSGGQPHVQWVTHIPKSRGSGLASWGQRGCGMVHNVNGNAAPHASLVADGRAVVRHRTEREAVHAGHLDGCLFVASVMCVWTPTWVSSSAHASPPVWLSCKTTIATHGARLLLRHWPLASTQWHRAWSLPLAGALLG